MIQNAWTRWLSVLLASVVIEPAALGSFDQPSMVTLATAPQ